MLAGVTVTGNTAQQFGGGALNATGARSLAVSSSTFVGNVAALNPGGAVSCASTPSATLSSVTMTANQGSNGGAVAAAAGCALTVTASSFASNEARVDGGAALVGDAASFVDCTFDSNKAAGGGGAILSNRAPSLGVSRSRFTGNTCLGLNPRGGAVAGIDTSAVTLSNVTFDSNIVQKVEPDLRIGDYIVTFYGSNLVRSHQSLRNES